MKGIRIFTSFGFCLPKQQKENQTTVEIDPKEIQQWNFSLNTNDWENVITGKKLTDFKLSSQLQALLSIHNYKPY